MLKFKICIISENHYCPLRYIFMILLFFCEVFDLYNAFPSVTIKPTFPFRAPPSVAVHWP